jgi:hypothetical protein
MRTHSVLVINPRSGQGFGHAAGLVDAARELGIEAHLLVAGEDAVPQALRVLVPAR